MATTLARGRPRCLLIALLLLAGCEQPPADASATFAERGDCSAVDPPACHEAPPRDERPTPESLAAQVQRDVAAIIRGMRQTSASNGL